MTKVKLKGGSLSGTYLIEENDFKFVRKEVSLIENREYGYNRWYSQLKRLQRYSVLFPGIFPNILKYGFDQDIAYFDMDHKSGYVTGYEFLSQTSDHKKIDQFLSKLIETMNTLHQIKIPSNPESIYLYVREEVGQKLNDCTSPKFRDFLQYQTITFNNEEVTSFIYQLQLFNNLFSCYQDQEESFTHGNLTLENLLYSEENNKIIFIDPYEENIIDSPLCDYSQLYQSCNARYEQYNSLPCEIIENNISINASKLEGLDYFNYIFTNFLKETCDENQYKVIKLLEISQFLRMLPFKMVIDEDKMIFFYGLASKLLNDLNNGNK